MSWTSLTFQWERPKANARGTGLQLRSHIMCSIAKKNKVPVKISDSPEEIETVIYVVGIDDLLIKI